MSCFGWELHLFSPRKIEMIPREYCRFVEVCEVCRQQHYLVGCLGGAGVGKTWAARRYANWDLIEPLLSVRGVEAVPHLSPTSPLPRTAFYTPPMLVTPRRIERDLTRLYQNLQWTADQARMQQHLLPPLQTPVGSRGCDLTIVDEVDRLSHASLQVLCDLFDRNQMGLVLLVRTLRSLDRHPLVSPRAVLHEFRALDQADVRLFLEEQLQHMGLTVGEKAVEVFMQTTGGNFQVMSLVLAHLERMVHRRGAFPVTGDVIEEVAIRLFTGRNV
jgi:AAA domain-containing protein